MSVEGLWGMRRSWRNMRNANCYTGTEADGYMVNDGTIESHEYQCIATEIVLALPQILESTYCCTELVLKSKRISFCYQHYYRCRPRIESTISHNHARQLPTFHQQSLYPVHPTLLDSSTRRSDIRHTICQIPRSLSISWLTG